MHLVVNSGNKRVISVTKQHNGTYIDKNENIHTEEKVKKSYLLNIYIKDSSSSRTIKVVIYDPLAKQLMGKSVDELYELEHTNSLLYAQQIDRFLQIKGTFGVRTSLRGFKGRTYANHVLLFMGK